MRNCSPSSPPGYDPEEIEGQCRAAETRVRWAREALDNAALAVARLERLAGPLAADPKSLNEALDALRQILRQE